MQLKLEDAVGDGIKISGYMLSYVGFVFSFMFTALLATLTFAIVIFGITPNLVGVQRTPIIIFSPVLGLVFYVLYINFGLMLNNKKCQARFKFVEKDFERIMKKNKFWNYKTVKK